MADPDPILVPTEIWGETLALMHRRLGFEPARSAGRWLLDQGHVRLAFTQRQQPSLAWELFAAGGGGLSFPDCTVLAWARDAGADVLAYDRGLGRRSRRPA